MKKHTPSMSMRASDVGDEIKKMLDVHIGKMEAQILRWGARLEGLGSPTAMGSSGVQIECPEGMDELKSKYEAALTRLANFKTVGDVRWGTYKMRVEEAWNDLESAYEELKSCLAKTNVIHEEEEMP